MHLGSNPPDVTYQPWNRITLVKPIQKTQDFKLIDFLVILRKQIDPTNRGFNQINSGDGRFVVQFKLHSVRAWNLTGRVISLSVDDFSDVNSAKGGRDQLCGLVDTGSQAHAPSVGYHLPANHRNHVLRTDDNESGMYLFNISCGDGDACVVYIDVMYRFDGPVSVPTLLLPDRKIIRELAATRDNTTRTTGVLKTLSQIANETKIAVLELQKIAENTEASKPSTISQVVNGIEQVAMLVSSIADLDFSETSSFAELDSNTE